MRPLSFTINKMENYKTIEQILDGMAPDTVYKTRKSLMNGVIVTGVAIACFASVNVFTWPATSNYPALLLSAGAITLVYGLIKTFYRPFYYVSKASRQKLRTYEVYFETNEKDKLIRLHNSDNTTEINSLKRTHSNGLKIRIVTTRDMKLCFSQVIGYVPFEFVILTAPRQHTIEEAAQLKRLI